MTDALSSQIKLLRISLGAEELALSLGLINRPDLGQVILASTHENLTEQLINAYLTAASHSLVARGICSLEPNRGMVMAEGIEKAIFPLAHFDDLLQISMEMPGKQDQTTVHVLRNRMFTSHFVRQQAIHYLEHGKHADLGEYIAGIFGNFGDTSVEKSLPVTSAALMSALNSTTGMNELDKRLATEGWPVEMAKWLVDDLHEPEYRGAIIRMNTGSSTSAEDAQNERKPGLLLLKGKNRSWLFTFADVEGEDTGTAAVVGRQVFVEKLQTFAL